MIMSKDRMRHRRVDLPAYQFVVYERPRSAQGKGSKDAYLNTIKKEAAKHILTPIVSDDVEVEICWATQARAGMRADIDNIIKPILDVLVGIAFDDDRRVRSVTATLFDKKKNHTLSGYVEDMGPLLFDNREDAVQIAIYSDTRLNELGGEDKVRKQRLIDFERRFPKKPKQKTNKGFI